MGGGLMQLVAYGVQDVYLTGNPQITFFKVVYRRHTNFAVEPIEQTFQGSPDFGKTVTAQINRNADLITKMYIKVDLKKTEAGVRYGWVRRLGHAMIDEVKMSIGGTNIEKQYGDWLNIWYELSHQTGQERGYSKMIGDVDELKNITVSKQEYTMYVPLQFWFCRNNGLALPLIALQYHDTRVEIKFRQLDDLVNYKVAGGLSGNNGKRPSTDLSMGDALLLVDYVYLDAEERKKFAQAAHEYLIDVIQHTGDETASSTTEKYKLTFNHPSKALYWAIKLGRYSDGSSYVAWATDGNWTAACERFAKLLWLSTRRGIEYAGVGGWNIRVAEAGGEVASPVARSELSASVLALLAKVTAQLVFATDLDGTADAGAVAPATVENVTLLSNTLSIADCSQTVAQLAFPDTHSAFDTGVAEASAAATTNTQAIPGKASSSQFINDHACVIRDHANYGIFADGSENPVQTGLLQLNSLDRFSKRDGNYFNYVQPYQHHTRTPADGINTYSFALNPEDHQPSGTANFSRIDNTTLILTLGNRLADSNTGFPATWLGSNSVAKVYATNYNVLRIMSGMGGLAYSN
jgi:hypothetical protein